MAEIEIIYESEEGCSSDFRDQEFCTRCRLSCAEDMGCRGFKHSSRGCMSEPLRKFIPYGDCANAYVKYTRKGWSGKNYEIEPPIEDPFSPHMDAVDVVLGRTYYERCVKVKLNGKVIFNNYDDEEVSV